MVSRNGFDSATITEIKKGSPADNAGIKVGDTIILFDGKKVRSMSELRELVLTQMPGDEVRITVMRGDKKLGIGVTVGQRGL